MSDEEAGAPERFEGLVSDLLGISARRMLQALADGETDPAALATLAAPRLRATPDWNRIGEWLRRLHALRRAG